MERSHLANFILRKSLGKLSRPKSPIIPQCPPIASKCQTLISMYAEGIVNIDTDIFRLLNLW